MKGGFHDELAKELQVTSVSSLGSSSASQYISSLDKNGDGVVSADELAAANTSSTSTTSTTKSSTATTGSDSASVTQKIAADIASLMLQLQQQSSSDDSSGDDGSSDGNSPKGILALMDSNSDGKLTTSELLSADPSAIAKSAGSSDDSVLTQVLTDMQTAVRAYQTTYGASPAADTASDEPQTL
jgi:Ca2+-binding EF-hand superfamily protein